VVYCCVLPIPFLCFLRDVVSCVVVSVTYIVFCVFGGKKMVEPIMEVVAEYEHDLRKMHLLPRFSYGRWMLPKDGASNRIFFTYINDVCLIGSNF